MAKKPKNIEKEKSPIKPIERLNKTIEDTAIKAAEKKKEVVFVYVSPNMRKNCSNCNGFKGAKCELNNFMTNPIGICNKWNGTERKLPFEIIQSAPNLPKSPKPKMFTTKMPANLKPKLEYIKPKISGIQEPKIKSVTSKDTKTVEKKRKKEKK